MKIEPIVISINFCYLGFTSSHSLIQACLSTDKMYKVIPLIIDSMRVTKPYPIYKYVPVIDTLDAQCAKCASPNCTVRNFEWQFRPRQHDIVVLKSKDFNSTKAEAAYEMRILQVRLCNDCYIFVTDNDVNKPCFVNWDVQDVLIGLPKRLEGKQIVQFSWDGQEDNCCQCKKAEELQEVLFDWQYRPRIHDREYYNERVEDRVICINMCTSCYDFLIQDDQDLPCLVGYDDIDAMDCLDCVFAELTAQSPQTLINMEEVTETGSFEPYNEDSNKFHQYSHLAPQEQIWEILLDRKDIIH